MMPSFGCMNSFTGYPLVQNWMQAGILLASRIGNRVKAPGKSAMLLKRLGLLVPVFWILPVFAGDAKAKKRPDSPAISAESARSGILWRNPGDVAARDLFYGSGGKQGRPRGSVFTFEKEDMNGSNPKFDVRAEDGTKWKLKLGSEARPETAATRLVWAGGYFTQDDYLLTN